jgi:hypothetical protein
MIQASVEDLLPGVGDVQITVTPVGEKRTSAVG